MELCFELVVVNIILVGTIFSTLLTSFILKCIINEFGSRVEELAEVEGGEIVGLHAVVLQGHAAVVPRSRVHVALPVRRVQDVREPRLLQAVAVQRRFPGKTRAAM